MKKSHLNRYFIIVGFFLSIFHLNASAALIGPSNPYLSFADSPFYGASFSWFYLEDFEDHLFNTPGVSANAGGVTSVAYGPSIHDSVDADDGSIDGSGLNGDSYFSWSGATGITFSFNANILGTLPTSAGIVWTDGTGTTMFEAFDAKGNSLGIIGPVSIADAHQAGETGEDTFFGVTHSGGISAIKIMNTVSAIEVDHLQYGAVVPIPPAAWLFGSGLLGLVGIARRRKLS